MAASRRAHRGSPVSDAAILWRQTAKAKLPCRRRDTVPTGISASASRKGQPPIVSAEPPTLGQRSEAYPQLARKAIVVFLLAHGSPLDLVHESLGVVDDEISAIYGPARDVLAGRVVEDLRPESE